MTIKDQIMCRLFFHIWEKWKIYEEEYTVTVKGKIVGHIQQIRMKRVCSNCGIIKDKPFREIYTGAQNEKDK
jgi:hypothetical protein